MSAQPHLHIIFCSTNREQAARERLTAELERASGSRIQVSFIKAQGHDVSLRAYNITAPNTPSYVHPVKSSDILEAVSRVDGRTVLLLDGSILPDCKAFEYLVQYVASGDERTVALPVQYNYCPKGPLTTYSLGGDLRFEFGILPQPIFIECLQAQSLQLTGDPLLSERAAGQGVQIEVAPVHLDRFPVLHFLQHGLERSPGRVFPAQQGEFEGLPLFYRSFKGESLAREKAFRLYDAMLRGSLEITLGAVDNETRAQLMQGVEGLEIASALKGDLRKTILDCMASLEPHMDAFWSMRHCLAFIIQAAQQGVGEAVKLGDRDFWAGFGRFTAEDLILKSMLLFMKG